MDMRYLAYVQEQSAREAAQAHAVRCQRCRLLVGPGDYGSLAVAPAAVHLPVDGGDGYAAPAESMVEDEVCPGSELLGRVE
jgi:hypothetical protein